MKKIYILKILYLFCHLFNFSVFASVCDDCEGWVWRSSLNFTLENGNNQFIDADSIHQEMIDSTTKITGDVLGSKNVALLRLGLILDNQINDKKYVTYVITPCFKEYIFYSGHTIAIKECKDNKNKVFKSQEQIFQGIQLIGGGALQEYIIDKPSNYPNVLKDVQARMESIFPPLRENTSQLGEKAYSMWHIKKRIDDDLSISSEFERLKALESTLEKFTQRCSDSEQKILFYIEDSLKNLPFYWDMRLPRLLKKYIKEAEAKYLKISKEEREGHEELSIKDDIKNSSITLETINFSKVKKLAARIKKLEDSRLRELAAIIELEEKKDISQMKVIGTDGKGKEKEANSKSGLRKKGEAEKRIDIKDLFKRVEELEKKAPTKLTIDDEEEKRKETCRGTESKNSIERLTARVNNLKREVTTETKVTNDGKKEKSLGERNSKEDLKDKEEISSGTSKYQRLKSKLNIIIARVELLRKENPLKVPEEFHTSDHKRYIEAIKVILDEDNMAKWRDYLDYIQGEITPLVEQQEKWVREFSHFMDKMSANRKIKGIVIHMNSLRDICDFCAPTIARECERKGGFVDKLKSICFASKGGEHPPFLRVLASCNEMRESTSAQKRLEAAPYQDKYSKDKNYLIPISDFEEAHNFLFQKIPVNEPLTK
jgi:hypothetical protein